ncbi:MAG: SulP family inorganic anion transporter [Fimbriimonadaceae bacterium]|nr:STAS domain-containing protein [Chthonomonadaceae bacterium]MCO5295693.1 SulP family inorganic anion transporter [Fimbriimonadaceae bacterium]
MASAPTTTPRSEWTPKLVHCLRGYTAHSFLVDAIAGVTVGLVALPLAMAFAISSGVSPQAGIYTAVVAGFFASALGGSRLQITGPTGAFVVVVAGIVAKYGLGGLALCTILAGLILLVLGLTGLGTAVKYIPRPVVVGFTNGIAVLIASTQIKDFFGLTMTKTPSLFLDRLVAIGAHWSTLSPAATAVAAGSLTVLIVFRRFLPRIPGAIVALVVGTLVAWGLRLPVETITSRFGGIPVGLPPLQVPEIHLHQFASLISPALTVAMLGAIESLMSAVVADRMSGDRHNPNVELAAQGVANLVSPLFGGIPATGAIARTATNIRSGAKTPVSGLIHAATLGAILLFAAPVAGVIPLAILAAILMMVAYNMGEWREIPSILKLSKADVAVWFVTFMLTVFADLTVAVEAGMILAALLYIARVTNTTTVVPVTEDYVAEGEEHSLQGKEIPDGVAIYRIHGPFLFGATDKLAIVTDSIEALPPVVILRLRNMTAIDATGIQALEDLAETMELHGRHLLLCGMRPQPARLIERAHFQRHLDPRNLCPHVDAALKRAAEILADPGDGEHEALQPR